MVVAVTVCSFAPSAEADPQSMKAPNPELHRGAFEQAIDGKAAFITTGDRSVNVGPLTEPFVDVEPLWGPSAETQLFDTGAFADRPSYVGWGLLAGAAAGVVWGTLWMKSIDAFMGPPLYIVTIPVGAAAGGAVGWLIGAITDSSSRT